MLIFPIAPSPDLAGEESSYASRSGVFSATETQEIVSKLDFNRWRVAEVGRQGEIDNSYRIANIQWLQPAQYSWVFERLAEVVVELNGRWFGFELAGFYDPLQVSRYEAGAGVFDWHTDRGSFINGRPPRKLTVIVQLSDPGEYQGGDVEILTGRDPQKLNRSVGGVHVFPSFVLHRVTEVTAGTRYSIVGWVSGPRFR
jgi:PKHD-type hydroxylase